MRISASAFVIAPALIAALSAPLFAADKLTLDDRVELVRGLMAEYGKSKVLIPRSKKNLTMETDGRYDKQEWASIAKDSGPAARVGDMVQVTKVDLGADRIVLQLNGGFRGGRHWYDSVQVGMGPSGNPNTAPISNAGNNDINSPGGVTIELLFHKPLEPIKAQAVKKMLAGVIDFDPHSATELYADTLPAPVQAAIREKRVLEGMTREQVIMAMGKSTNRSRETNKDGLEVEDWVYGAPPGKITFVTFNGNKVIKVKEEYAGLGTESASQTPVIIHQ
jgi:hypothetical protein